MKSKWEIDSLGKHISQQSVRNPGLEDIDVYSVTNSEGFTKSTDYFSKKVFSKDLSSYKLVKRNQFAYNPSRINVGSIAYLTVTDYALVSPLYVIFEVRKETLHPDYLLRYLKSHYGIVQIGNNTQGSVRDSLKYNGLEKIKIPLPPLKDQICISAILTRVENLIGKRKESLNVLDEFLESLFMETFGDPVLNKRAWSERPIIDGCKNKKDIKCGPFGTQLNKGEFKKYGVPLWGIRQINSNFKISPVDFVTAEKAEELKDYSIEPGDIVMSRKGTVGKCALYPAGLQKGVMHSDVLRIRLAKNVVNPIFLCFQLRISKKVEKQIEALSEGAIMAGINVSKLKSINVLYPPLPLQNQFANMVEKVNAMKERYTKSLVELENLYNSLSQRAFNGELDLCEAGGKRLQ